MGPGRPARRRRLRAPGYPRDAAGKVVDFFCGGDTPLPDGSVLSAGGTPTFRQPNPLGLPGRREVLAFDPRSGQWAHRAAMPHGRWYPSLITLGGGRILAACGLNEDSVVNTALEVYAAASDTWQELATPPAPRWSGLPLYAHLFLLADGRVFFTGGRMDDPMPVGPAVLDLTRSPIGVAPVGGLQDPTSRDQSASVLLPPRRTSAS